MSQPAARRGRGPLGTAAVALLAVALTFAVLMLLRRLIGYMLPDGAGRLSMIHSDTYAAPLIEVVVNLIPGVFAGAFGILLANRLTAPQERPSLTLAVVAMALAAALTLVVLLVDLGIDAGPPLGVVAVGFGTLFGLLLPAIR